MGFSCVSPSSLPCLALCFLFSLFFSLLFVLLIFCRHSRCPRPRPRPRPRPFVAGSRTAAPVAPSVCDCDCDCVWEWECDWERECEYVWHGGIGDYSATTLDLCQPHPLQRVTNLAKSFVYSAPSFLRLCPPLPAPAMCTITTN